MVANTKQKEIFIINDIDMEINPSDIQVMDDNWVMEDSFLRSKAVFCYRSKYSATKVVLNIPFQISYLNEDNKVSINNTYNCIKLISELNSYPFCFIKNNRIKAYISTTNVSATDYMIFAVDELAVVQDAQASNMVFLEVVLQYYNHVPLIKDFEFRSNLNVALNSSGLPFQDPVAPIVVGSLKESEVWKKYTLPRVTKVFDNLTKSGLLNYVEPNSHKIHPMMAVKLYTPIMSVITEGIENVDDGRYLGEDSKVITVTDTSSYDNGSFEDMLMSLSSQDFSGIEQKYNPEKVQTINSENRIKTVETKDSKETVSEIPETIVNPFYGSAQDRFRLNQELEEEISNINKAEKGILTNSKDVYIDWVGSDLQEMALGINKIEVRKKNRLVTHQIGSFKHPIVQFMGAYPLTVNISLSSTNFEIYQRDESPVNAFIKQVFNVLDFNRNSLPEAEAYNFIKIKSLATHLFDIESFLPSQSILSASSNTQGLENIVYTFHQGDLTSFIEQGKVEASGANSLDTTQEQINDIIVEYLKGMPHELVDIVNNSNMKSNISNTHILQTYKAIIELSKEAMKEMSIDRYPQFQSIETAINHINDLKPNNNISRDYVKIENSNSKVLSKFTLYKDYIPERDNSLTQTELKEINNNIAVKKYGQLASGSVPKKANESYDKIIEAKKENASKLTTLQFHNSLIPFMVYVLETRANLHSGKETNIENVSYTPSGRFNNLSLSIISKINSGFKEGAIVNRDSFKNKNIEGSEEVGEQIGEILDSIVNKHSKKFFGYNIEDLDFEILSPVPYDRLTDLLIPQVDPFFFLVETQILDGNEFTTIYEKMYKGSKYNENLLTNLNDRTLADTDEVDTTQEKFEVEYRKLEEVEYKPLDTSSVPTDLGSGFGLLTLSQMGSLPDSGETPANAKQMDPSISAAIEKALRKYGKDKDEGFRRYTYAVLLAESGNKNKQKSETGAVGLFQATRIFVKDIVMNPNTLEYSNGQRVGVGSSSSFVKQVKARSSTDMYLSTQMFIESYLKYNKSNSDPIKAYMRHNVGPEGERSVSAVLAGKDLRLSAAAKTAIRRQGRGRYIRSNDYQTAQAYSAFVKRKMSIDNVPDHIRVNADKNIKDTTADILKNINTNKTNTTIPYKAQQEKVDLMSQDYKEATVSKEDRTSNQNHSNRTIKGVVSKVVDGDTVKVRGIDGKEYDIRLYGIDTPESVDPKNAEIGGKLASKQLNALLSGKNVTVQLTGKDKHNRHVGVINLKDGTNSSLVMLRNGSAFLSDGFTKVGDYSKAQDEAKKNQKGLWSYPDGVITKPRSENKVDLTGINTTQANLIKNNTNPISFTSKDLQRAKQVGGNKLNNFQPFEGGRKFRISDVFGPRVPPTKGASSYHKAVDFDSPIGTPVIASASGKVTIARVGRGYGNYIEINHGNGFSTRYAHLDKILVRVGDKVQYKQRIALSGNTGIGTGAHLHYEVRYNGVALNPFGTKELHLYKGDSPASGQVDMMTSNSVDGGDYYNPSHQVFGKKPEGLVRSKPGVTDENTVFNEDALADAIFDNIYANTNVGLKSSIPAIKVYMTIGNENDKLWLDTIKGDVLYYEVKGIKSFKMNCNNDANPVDTALLTIADPSFLNTDGFSGLRSMPGVNINAIGTSQEMQFKNNRIQLKVGNKLQVKLGYGNDPNKLETVFNGSIADLSINNQTLSLMLEGFGKELVNEILSPHKPSFLNEQADNISTSSVIGESLFAENIEHFGYSSGYWANKFRQETDPESKALAPGRFSFSYNWGYDFTPAQFKSRLFINVFSPEIEMIDDEFKKYWSGFSVIATMFTNHAAGYPFAVYRMTPWQCMKQMEYRHPNTICKPMMYEDRMSLFYGIKEQMYFKRELSKPLQKSAAIQKEEGGIGYDLSDYYNNRRDRMSPVSNIHLVTSNSNLINNGLRINASYATRVRVTYSDSDVLTDASEITKPWKLETFEANADDNLYPFDIRTKELSLSGCLSRYSSFLYGTTELKKEAEKMYSGKILVLGNPTIKAGDYVFIDDADRRMNGLVLVRECYHHFDEKSGFMTEIVPGQYVEAANFMYSSLWLNLICSCKIVSAKMRTVIGTNYSSEDFEMVSSYLTILRQAELEMNEVSKEESSIPLNLIYLSVVGLSAYLINTLSKTAGISNRNSLFKSLGITTSAGVWGFSKNMYKILATDTDKKIKNRLQAKISKMNTGARSKLNLILNKSKVDIKGLLAQPRHILASNKFIQSVKERASLKNSSLIWKGTSKVLGLGAKATIEASKLLVRATFSIALAVTFTNPLTILLDLILFAAIQYGFSKIEENSLMRQPLLYFPLIRHGRPYVGGMAGLVRNSWLDSQKMEAGKTYKELQKAANVLIGNNDVTNLSHDKPFYVSLLGGFANKEGQKVVAPLKQTNSDGIPLVVEDNKVMTSKERQMQETRRYQSYLQDEEVLKRKLIHKVNQQSVGNVTNE